MKAVIAIIIMFILGIPFGWQLYNGLPIIIFPNIGYHQLMLTDPVAHSYVKNMFQFSLLMGLAWSAVPLAAWYEGYKITSESFGKRMLFYFGILAMTMVLLIIYHHYHIGNIDISASQSVDVVQILINIPSLQMPLIATCSLFFVAIFKRWKRSVKRDEGNKV